MPCWLIPTARVILFAILTIPQQLFWFALSTASASPNVVGSNRTRRKKWPGYYKCDDLVPPLCDDDRNVTVDHIKPLRNLKVTFWRYTPSQLDANKFPIVVVNGGPGLPHNFEKHTRNLACDGREVVLYDQAGTGASALPNGTTATENYPELLDLKYYAETELPALIQKLKYKRYHILGNSWGTMVAFQFAVTAALEADRMKYQSLESLILNAPIADNRKFVAYQWDPENGSVGTLPTFLQERLRALNRTQDFDSLEFQALQGVVTASFVARLGMPVDCWQETVDAGINGETATAISGQTDFFLPSGSATNWTVLDQMHKIAELPIQLNYGGHDMVRPALIADTVQHLRNVECNRLDRAGHSVLLDAPSECYPRIRDFLVRLEDSFTDKNRPFRPSPNAVCPSKNDGGVISSVDGSNGDASSSAMVATTNGTSQQSFAFTVLIAVIVSFGLGTWFGRKGRKRSDYDTLDDAAST